MKSEKQKAFTLAEMLIAVLMASIIMIVMAPVITQKTKERPPEIRVTQEESASVPVGSIVLWYGSNIPETWIECSGQNLNTPGLEELRIALGGTYQFLPNLNLEYEGLDSNLKWIIRARKN